MAQLTIYLDDKTEKHLRDAAAAANVPVSRWVADAIKARAKNEWPESVRQAAGSWEDFPDLAQLRENTSHDVARESL